jgi:hypothetical protein
MILGLGLFASSQADAAGDDTGGGMPDQPAVISVGVQYGSAPAGVAGKDSHQCFWTPAGAGSTTEGAVVDTRVVDGAVQHLFVRSCPGSLDLIWVSQVSPRVLGRLATDMAKALVPKPSFGSAPVADTGVVNVDMWLWTDPGEYGVVRTREVWVPTPTGPITAQAVATPLHLVFTPGEPGSEPFACDGPGQRWEPAFGEDAKSACTYRYLHSSEISGSGTFSAQWSIVWSIRWYSNHAVAETLPAFVTTTSREITVKEIQAVIVG